MSEAQFWDQKTVNAASAVQKASGSKPLVDRVIEFVRGQGKAVGDTTLISDEEWIEQQFNLIPGPNDGYSDKQFAADIRKANHALEERAERARQQMKDGTSKKYPK